MTEWNRALNSGSGIWWSYAPDRTLDDEDN